MKWIVTYEIRGTQQQRALVVSADSEDAAKAVCLQDLGRAFGPLVKIVSAQPQTSS